MSLGELNVNVDLATVPPQALGQLEFDKPLGSLTLVNPTDKSVAELSRLPKMCRLVLRDSRLTPVGCRQLAVLAAGVTELALWQTGGDAAFSMPGIGDAEFAELAALDQLELLSMSGGSVSADGLAHLAAMKKLKTLSLSDCPKLCASDLAPLAKLEQLRSISLEFRILPVALTTIGQIGSLEEATLVLGHLRPQDVAPLAGLKHLRTLSIDASPEIPWDRERQRTIRPAAVPLGDAIAQAAGQMPDLRILSMGIPLGNSGLEVLAVQGKLQSLQCDLVEVNDRSLELAGRMSDLRQLRLEGQGKLTDAGLAPLGKLTRMVDLIVPMTGVSDAGLAHLAPLQAIEYLNLSGSKVTGAGLAALKNASSLKSLGLADSLLDDAGCRLLTPLAALESLDLSGTRISDEGLELIGRLANLRELLLDGTAVSDGALARLEGLAKLRSLYVLDTAITAEAISSLKAAIPGCRVVSAFKVMASFPDGLILVEDANGDRTFVPLQNGEGSAAEGEMDLADDEDAGQVEEMVEPADAADEPEESQVAEVANGQSPAGQEALAKLKALGARWENENPSDDPRQGYGHGVRLVIKIWSGPRKMRWDGTAADWKLLEAIDQPEHLVLYVDTPNLAGLSEVHFSKPLAGLMLIVESADRVAELTHLPECRWLHLNIGDLDLPLSAFRRVIRRHQPGR